MRTKRDWDRVVVNLLADVIRARIFLRWLRAPLTVPETIGIREADTLLCEAGLGPENISCYDERLRRAAAALKRSSPRRRLRFTPRLI
ncbi:MAG: hypothetical protein UY23_C0004G0031 [Candidatus Jorgensenbacteria bacterium GW2011_GWA1_48_11]|uniref:Uncharacterized protein n=1 Tax=Candidatus Jorgensenbacteria bacterium GW2011_GWA1_48_11 TaxID=1618660 RepID=A0A0G1UAA3_9BACT|nr:MAG: hypothetical protein UY23_C0004G0031 [Candidatus Jorgensenbacteria bacterium GW2011_GWA1_48_11]KKW11788.1 MAG: hypothetical protein UY51_C0005G0029 [Candidatus Jorgensenbacteria bacterium GW2011_GWB1_49_9]